MAYTGVFGHNDSMPANIILAGDEPNEGGTEFDRNLESELSLVQDVIANIKSESVTSTLVLAQDVVPDLPEDTSSTLALVQSITTNIKSLSASNTLALVSTPHINFFSLNVSNTLALTQSAEQPFIDEEVSSVLSLTQSATAAGSTQSYGLSSFLVLTQTTSEHFAVANRSITHHLDFQSEEEPGLTQAVNFVYVEELESTLALTHEGAVIYVASNTLALTQTAVAATGRDVESILELDHAVARNLVYGRSVESAMVLRQAVAYEVERADTLCTYTPFVGTNGDGGATTPPSTTPPSLGSATLTLTFPFDTPTTTLELRNPEFGNNRTLNFTRIFGETRGGSLIVYSDPIWPKTKSLSLQIAGLSESQTESLLDFLGDSLGMEVGLLDWENQQWRGIITTPDAEVTDNGRCNKTVSFQFEGAIV